MTSKELMESLYGVGAPYAGMDIEWEVFAGIDAPESGPRKGKLDRITWCQHCGLPTFVAVDEHGGGFTVRLSKDGRWVCGKDAPE